MIASCPGVLPPWRSRRPRRRGYRLKWRKQLHGSSVGDVPYLDTAADDVVVTVDVQPSGCLGGRLTMEPDSGELFGYDLGLDAEYISEEECSMHDARTFKCSPCN